MSQHTQRTWTDVTELMNGCRVVTDGKIWDASDVAEIRDAIIDDMPGAFQENLVNINRQELGQKKRKAEAKLESAVLSGPDRQEYENQLKSAIFHIDVCTAIENLWRKHICPVPGKWGADEKQKNVLKVVKLLYQEFKLPLHITYKKLYVLNCNRVTAANKKAKKQDSGQPAAKDAERVSKTHRFSTHGGKRKKPEPSAKDVATKVVKQLAKQASSSSKRARTKKSDAKKEVVPRRVGASGKVLATGPCVLGSDDEQYARASILSLNPPLDLDGSNQEFREFSFPDGVLVTVTGAITGQGANYFCMYT